MEFTVLLLYPLNDIVRSWRAFYQLEEQSVDTLIVGSSHAFASFDIELINSATGDNTYILASNSQNVIQTYFNIQEMLKYQTPDVIILEAYSINGSDNFREEDTGDRNWKKESNIDGMRFSLTKLQAILSSITPRIGLMPYFLLSDAMISGAIQRE